MDIGLHLLEGNVVTLKLPFLAVEKKKKRTLNDSNAGDDTEKNQNDPARINSEDSGPNNKSDSSLEIIGVIRKKIIFKTRPKPNTKITT